MSESHNVDHWASLASNLGAEPAPEEPKSPVTAEAGAEEPTAPAAPPPPAFRPPAKSAPATRRPARPSAWEQLAGDLGIAPAPPPQPQAIPVTDAIPAAVAIPPSSFVLEPPASVPPRVV